MCGTMSSIKVLNELKKITKDREIGSGQVCLICFFKALDIVLNSRKVIAFHNPTISGI